MSLGFVKTFGGAPTPLKKVEVLWGQYQIDPNQIVGGCWWLLMVTKVQLKKVSRGGQANGTPSASRLCALRLRRAAAKARCSLRLKGPEPANLGLGLWFRG